jgi:hypothetical protein
MATRNVTGPALMRHRIPSRKASAVALRVVLVGAMTALAVACINVERTEKEPADFSATNGCMVPIFAVGGPKPTFFSGTIDGPSIAPGSSDKWKTWFDLADVGSSGAFYVWVEPATAKQWGPPIEVEFSALRQIESESTVPQFTYEVSGALCPES